MGIKNEINKDCREKQFRKKGNKEFINVGGGVTTYQ
jgi:hypothetical protein